MGKSGRPLVWAVVGALGLAATYGRVALLHLAGGVVGGDIDGYENLWNHYWVRTALLDLHQSPFYTQHIYYPTGISLRFHALNPFNGLLALPLTPLLGDVATTNALFLLALVLTHLFAFLLIRDIVGSNGAAFVGAALFTYANSHTLAFYSTGQDNLLSGEWLPLYFFCLLRAVQNTPHWVAGAPAPPMGRARRGWAAGAVATLIITSLTDWQYVMWEVFTTLLYFGFMLLTRRTRQQKAVLFGTLALIGGSYTVLVGPLLVGPMVQEALANPWLIVAGESAAHAADLADLLGPGLGNPGYLALALAVLGGVAARRGRDREPALFWALAALVFYILALGPILTVGGKSTGIPLPYGLLQNLPVFSVGRDPGRFEVIGRLGLGILTAFGLRTVNRWLWSSVVGRQSPVVGRQSPVGNGQSTPPTVQPAALRFTFYVLRFTFPALVLLFSLAPFVAAAGQVTVDPPEWPAFYRQLAQEPNTYALLELPLFTEKGRGEDHYQAYQALHGKPRFGGRWSRDHKLDNPANFVKHAGLFHQLLLLDAGDQAAHFYPAQDFLRRTDYATQGQAILNYYQVGYIVVYKQALDSAWNERTFQRIIGQILGAGIQPTYEDSLLRAYRVPAGGPAVNPLTLDTGDGWYESETREDGVTYRWANTLPTDPNAAAGAAPPPGELYTMNLTQQPITATLHFTAFAFRQPRVLNVALDGVPLAHLSLPGNETLTPAAVALTLPPGNHRLSFRSPTPALGTGTPQDTRRLSFALAAVRLDAK